MKTIDYDLLENRFYFTPIERDNAVISINAAELLHEANMDQFIRTYMPLIKALDLAAAGAIFCGWFRTVCLVQQYAISFCDSAFDLSLSNLTIQVYLKNNNYWFSFKCDELRLFSAPTGEREKWREEVLTAFYRDQIQPLLESVSQSAQVNVGLLWSQIHTGFQYYIDMFIEEAADESGRRQIRDDYRFLSERLDGAVFGRKRNPFDVKIRRIENPYEPGKTMCMKTSCCMYYRTEGGDYCYACPRLTNVEREERREKILAQA